MGVSRPSVREAIAALQIVGILETHTGDGTYIAKQYPKQLLNLVEGVLEKDSGQK